MQKIFAIVGYYDCRGISREKRPVEMIQALMSYHKGSVFSGFMVVAGEEILEGYLKDPLGDSKITAGRLTGNLLEFSKQYSKKEVVIQYSLVRSDDSNVWKGKYTMPGWSGNSRLVMTEVPPEFF